MRILVLWERCGNISEEADASWVRDETAKLRNSGGIAGLALHKLESAALRYPRSWDWCLELDIDGELANTLVRRPPCSEFLADLRLLGTRPRVVVLPEQA